MKKFTITLLALVASLAALPATADICRWKDANGRTQYSDAPPPGVQCIGTVKPGGAPSGAAGTAAAPKSIQEREMDFRKRRLDKLEAEQKAKQDKEQSDAKRAMCENARARVMGLQRGGRVARYDSSGQIQYLDEEAIAKEVADAQRMADEACK